MKSGRNPMHPTIGLAGRLQGQADEYTRIVTEKNV